MPIHPQDPSLMSFPSISSHKNESNRNKYKQKIQVRNLNNFHGNLKTFSFIFFLQKLQEENSKLHDSLDQKTEEVSSLTDRIAKLTNSIDSLTLECSSVSTAKVRKFPIIF
jgi:predicted nuclease with TOPRIM domain